MKKAEGARGLFPSTTYDASMVTPLLVRHNVASAPWGLMIRWSGHIVMRRVYFLALPLRRVRSSAASIPLAHSCSPTHAKRWYLWQ